MVGNGKSFEPGEGMADDRIDRLNAMLVEAEEAHGTYETTELNGVYDQAWPRWYAAYAVAHGIHELVGHDISTEKLAAFLDRTFVEFKAASPASTDPWAAYTARRIVAEL